MMSRYFHRDGEAHAVPPQHRLQLDQARSLRPYETLGHHLDCARCGEGNNARPAATGGRMLLTKLSKLSKVIRGGHPACVISSLAFR